MSAALLIITLILLLFTGQTVIFLLRLVAADKRSRRTPRSATARKTVGMLEDESAPPPASRIRPQLESDVPTTSDGRSLTAPVQIITWRNARRGAIRVGLEQVPDRDRSG